MPNRGSPEPDDPEPTALDDALRALPDIPIPEGLLGSCLTTIPADRRRPRSRRAGVLRMAAASLLIASAVGLFARSRHADAAGLLQDVKAAWAEVPASHRIVRVAIPNHGIRTEETWASRRLGVRKETRVAGDLVGVVARGSRWEFRWDVRNRTVAAWSTELASRDRRPEDQGLAFDRDGFEAWAKAHRAEIVAEAGAIDGREVRKIVLNWPGGDAKSQRETVWFDPKSLLPVKQRSEAADGVVIETTIDYPDPEAMPGNLFAFAIPRGVTLEVNDPDLGRQLYSEDPGAKR